MAGKEQRDARREQQKGKVTVHETKKKNLLSLGAEGKRFNAAARSGEGKKKGMESEKLSIVREREKETKHR